MVVFGNISLPVALIVCLTPRKHEIRSENRGMPVGIAGFVQVCRFSAFLQVAGKGLQSGKMFENGNTFTKRGKYSPLRKCSPKRENIHVQ